MNRHYRGSFEGQGQNDSDVPSQTFGRGRTCRADGCKTVLSMYNDGEHCVLHAPRKIPRTRGKKLVSV